MLVFYKNNGLFSILNKLFVNLQQDTVIFERLREDQLYKENTVEHMEEYATEGLRTLCISMNELDPDEYEEWNKKYYEASTALENRDEKVDETAELIEKVHVNSVQYFSGFSSNVLLIATSRLFR